MRKWQDFLRSSKKIRQLECEELSLAMGQMASASAIVEERTRELGKKLSMLGRSLSDFEKSGMTEDRWTAEDDGSMEELPLGAEADYFNPARYK